MANTTIDIGPELPEVEYDDTPPNTGPRLTTTANCADEIQDDDTCNNYYPTEQEYLQQKAANTNTGGTLWTHFPKGGTGVFGPSNPVKDPYRDFLQDFGPF
jgi:hypothetical protein